MISKFATDKLFYKKKNYVANCNSLGNLQYV